VFRIRPTLQHYAWGSTTSIPDRLGLVPDGRPVAEAWFGAHPLAPSLIDEPDLPGTLDAYIAADPATALGTDVATRFGSELPYLLKLIAAASPLSLQVHPSRSQARRGYAAEDEAGVSLAAPHRSYRDRNHKPELVYALTRLDAMVGFRAPRRAAELLQGLEAPLAKRLREQLVGDPTSSGVSAAFAWLLAGEDRPGADEVAELADACGRRLEEGSPSPRTDRTVMRLAAAFPGDAGAVTSVLLNPVTLRPGEALFVPTGTVHAYLSGFGVEIMANSDNVLRAGLTGKHIDVPELLKNVDTVAAPPIRIAPERGFSSTETFYAPVDDFELSITRLSDEGTTRIPGRGPRIVLCLEGEVTVRTQYDGDVLLVRGEAAFVPARDGAVIARGDGVLAQADVP
jgi:mannose-6-phosphate isomerase